MSVYRAAHLALVFAIFPALVFAQKSTIQPADLANLKRVEAPRISPDGKLIAYTVDTPVAAGKHRDAHIWLVPADHSAPARPFVQSASAESSPEWSPDGSQIAFLSDRPNPLAHGEAAPYQVSLDPSDRPDIPPAGKPETPGYDKPGTQLWLIPVNGGEAQPLTNLPGSIKQFRWSPDGKSIAFVRADADSKEEHARKEAKNDETHVDANYHYDRIWIYDIGKHSARLLTAQDMNIDTLDWSPDGKLIASRVSPTPRIDDYWRVSKVILFDASNGAVNRVVEEHSGYQPPIFSHDGSMLSFSRFTPIRGITDIHVVKNLADGKEIRLEDKYKGTIDQMLWLGSGHKLLIGGYIATHTAPAVVDINDFMVTPLPGITTSSEDFSASFDGKSLAYLGDSPSAPHEVYVSTSGTPTALTNTNPQVANWNLGSQREISWTNPKDHRTVYGVVVLPPDYKAGTRYKTVIHIHGGPEEAWTIGFNGNWYDYATMLASHGYVVLLPDPRGSDGQGPDFAEANFQDWGNGDFGDIMAGVDYLISQGITDPQKMVVGGWSFGGFMTSWTVTHTDRFKAGMVGAAVTDLFTMGITTDIAPSYEDSYFKPLPGNFEMYDKHSPVRYVANCHTPVLVMHGEADVRVPLSQGQEFYHALRFHNKEAIMVTYPREPHIFNEREHQIDSLTRILAWYDTHTGN